MSSLDSVWLKKIRFLYQLLMISLSLNAGLILAMSYKGVKKTVRKNRTTKKINVKRASKVAVIEACFELSNEELVDLLGSKEHIEDGLCYRDIALSCLINFHDFAFDRVFLTSPFEKKELVICKAATHEVVKMDVILGLDDQSFSSIQSFAKKERFAVTLRGLFYLMQDEKNRHDYDKISTLLYIQEPFCILYSSIKELYPKLQKQLLLKLILSASYELFEEFSNKVVDVGHSDGQICLTYLKKYLFHQSKIACHLLMKIDQDYCVHQLDQREMLQFIALLDKPNLEVVIALKRILCSLRTNEIHEAAAKKLYEFAGQTFLKPYNHKQALKKFLPTFYSSNLGVNKKNS